MFHRGLMLCAINTMELSHWHKHKWECMLQCCFCKELTSVPKDDIQSHFIFLPLNRSHWPWGHLIHKTTLFIHKSYWNPYAKESPDQYSVFFFSSEKAAMSVGWGSTFLLLGLYYRIVVSYKRLRLGLSSEKDIWGFFAPITTSSLLFKLNIKHVKYRKNPESLNWNPGPVQSQQVFRPLLDKYLRILLPYSGTVLVW